MSQQTIQLGFLGVGFMGQAVHLPNFISQPDCRVQALCDARLTTAQAVADRFQIPKTYPSLDDMLASEELDALVAITSAEGHRGICQAALERGLPVFVEKPLSYSAAEAEAIAGMERDGAKVTVGYMKRYDPGVLAAKRILDDALRDGRWGELRYVQAFCFGGDWICGSFPTISLDDQPHPLPPTAWPEDLPPDWRDIFHSYINVNCHVVNLLRFFLGEGRAESAKVTDDLVMARLDFSGVGCHLTYASTDTGAWWEELLFVFPHGWMAVKPAPPLLRNVSAQVTCKDKQSHTVTVLESRPQWAFEREAAAFVESLRDATPLPTDSQDSIADLRLIESIFESALPPSATSHFESRTLPAAASAKAGSHCALPGK